jgi:mannose-1-phosphate guanylyltransferase
MSVNPHYYVVIMAGGIGSRFWPFSRTKYPKQFHDVLGQGKTMLQQTADRFKDVCLPENIYVVTNKDYKGLVKESLPFLNDHQILLEPTARNTAPCIAYACHKIAQKDPDAVLVISPSDHVVTQEENFKSIAISALNKAATSDVLLTIGITPSRPDTGYGYIQFVESESEFKKVKTFTEKPNLELAEQFVSSGDFVWNAGIFIWSAKSILKAFEQLMPEMNQLFDSCNKVFYSDAEQEVINKVYSQCKNISIDYAIMEKASNVYTILAEFGWSDLGTWKSLYEVSNKSPEGNVVSGKVLLYDTKNSIIKTSKDKLVVIQGLDGYIVAEFDGVLMICKKEEEQKVKEFVADVKALGESKFI